MLSVFLSVSAHALGLTKIGYDAKDASEGSPLPDSAKLPQFKSGSHIVGFKPDKVYMASFDYAFSMEFVGSRKVEPKVISAKASEHKQETGLLGRVEYPDQWKGITIRYDATDGGIAESTYIIEPGAEVKSISLRYNVPVEAGPDGSLRFKLPSKKGWMKETAPVAWQEIGGNKVPVKVAFKVTDGLVGFEAGKYDPRHALIIDPTYQWHTFYGQAQGDEGRAIALDGSGNVYVTGLTFTSVPPGTWYGDAGQPPLHPYSGGSDIMVMKLNSSGEYQWHTYYGDGDRQWANGIAVDGSGNVYVTGFTDGGQWLGDGNAAPLRQGQYDGAQIVVLKLNTNGVYQWHTFYGYWVDEGNAIAVGGDGVYVTGYSSGTPQGAWVDMPAAVHAHSGSGYDIMVLKLGTNGAYQWHTFYGAAGNDGSDEGHAITVDGSGNVYVAGESQFTWQGDGATNPLHDHSYPGTSGKPDIVVLKLNSNGAYQWHTFYGATYTSPYWATGEVGNGIAVDENGNVYVTGESSATWGTPLHGYSGSQDITVLKLDTNGAYQWHTFYGSESHNYGHAITVSGDSVYVAGDGFGTWLGDGGIPPVHAYGADSGLTILKLDSNGAYRWHTFYDRSGSNVRHGIATDGAGGIFVSGTSIASWLGDGNMPPIHAYTSANDITVLRLDDTRTLTVEKAGTGTVTSSPPGITCGSTCSSSFMEGTIVTLTAAPANGSIFTGWSGGGCSGTGNCNTTMNSDKTVTATFAPANPCTYTLSLSSKTFPVNGASVGVMVRATGATSCLQPDLAPSDSWITAAFTPAGWRNNKGTVKITVAKSTTSLERSGSVTFAADKATFAITQKPVVCNITKLLPASRAFGVNGAPGAFDITLSAQDCAWTAAPNLGWITSDSAGTGSATVNYIVNVNDSGKARTGKITVTLVANGKIRTHTVRQQR
jgi:hypothetical protein